jgi:hypothetical protein
VVSLLVLRLACTHVLLAFLELASESLVACGVGRHVGDAVRARSFNKTGREERSRGPGKQ